MSTPRHRISGRYAPILLGAALLALCTQAEAAGDGFSDVSFTVSGSPGAWLLDFTVIPIDPANMAPKSYISNFQIGVEGGVAVGQPSGYASSVIAGDTAWQGTKNVSPSLQQSAPAGISGFESLVTSATAPTSVRWSVLLASGSFLNDFYVHGAYQATVFDSGVVGNAPEPGTGSMLLLGLGVVGAVSWSRRNRASG